MYQLPTRSSHLCGNGKQAQEVRPTKLPMPQQLHNKAGYCTSILTGSQIGNMQHLLPPKVSIRSVSKMAAKRHFRTTSPRRYIATRCRAQKLYEVAASTRWTCRTLNQRLSAPQSTAFAGKVRPRTRTAMRICMSRIHSVCAATVQS